MSDVAKSWFSLLIAAVLGVTVVFFTAANPARAQEPAETPDADPAVVDPNTPVGPGDSVAASGAAPKEKDEKAEKERASSKSGAEENCQVSEKNKTQYAKELEAICKSECGGGDKVCFDVSNMALACPATPDDVAAGDSLEVLVFGVKSCNSDAITVSSATKKNLDSLFDGAKKEESGLADAKLVELKKRSSITVSSDESVIGLAVTVAYGEAKKVTHKMSVSHGKYYLSTALLLPLSANTRYEAVSGASDGEPILRQRDDLHFVPSVALNIFLFGGKEKGLPFFVSPSFNRSFANLVALQVGAGLDFSDPKPPLYGGLLFEPIQGVGISTGVSLKYMDVLNEDAEVGMLVRDKSDLPVDENYTARPYIGLTLSNRVVDAILAARSGFAGKSIQ